MRRRTLVKGLGSSVAVALVGGRLSVVGRAQEAAPGVPAYDYVDLGGSPGIVGWSGATSVGEDGVVAGWAVVGTDPLERHAVVWRDGAMTDYGPPGASFIEATGVSPNGLVVGWYRGSDQRHYGAFWLSPGEIYTLRTLVEGDTVATGVNARNDVVGYTEIEGPSTRAILWRGEEILDLGSLGGDGAAALAVNDAGQVVGFAALPGHTVVGMSGTVHAFMWEDGVITDLGALPGGTVSAARAVNAGGVAAGYGRIPGGYFEYHAALWKDGGVTDLGTLGGPNSDAYGINDAGVAVGEAYADEYSPVAALFADGAVIDLNDVADVPDGFTLQLATDINNAGQICGHGNPDGVHNPRAFLLTPRSAATPTA